MFNLPFFLAQTAQFETIDIDPSLFVVPSIIALILAVIMIAAWWVIFSKAGKPGIFAIIPLVNVLMLIDIAGKPMWWFLLLLIPFVNFIIIIMLWLGLAENFGKGTGFALGLILLNPIFMLLLAFGDAEYQG